MQKRYFLTKSSVQNILVPYKSKERICSNCVDHGSDSLGDQRRSSIVNHESNDSHESALSNESHAT